MVGTVLVRQIQKKDLPTLVRIETSLFGDENGWKENDFQLYAKMPGASMIVACNTFGDQIGHLEFTQSKAHAVITNIAVATGHQRCGVGTELINHVQSCVRAVKNSGTIEMMTKETAVALQCFLRYNGFLWEQTLETPYEATDESGYIMTWICIPESRLKFIGVTNA